ncbi:MAG: radical SAM protein [Treponemataceae bacterium]|nr:radical SAM protein [Treponemataceae bacterium]
MTTRLPLLLCTTLLIETSPQALPLGAACVASAIKNDSRTKNLFDVRLVHISREESGFPSQDKNASGVFVAERIAEYAKNCGDSFKYCAFSVYMWNRAELEEAAGILKKQFPGLITVAGGPEVTANPHSFVNFDYTVAGEGEVSVPELFALLEKQNHPDSDALQNLPQGVFRNGIIPAESSAAARSFPPDLNTLSSPYLDGTLDVAEFGGALWELARGCPFKCSYCYESRGEKKVRYFPMERIEKELDLFNSKKISQVFVLDPTYNASKKRALELLRLIEKKAPGMFFYFEARAEFIDRELAAAFTRIPCALQFGLQSADPEVLKHVNRTLDKKLFVRNVGYLNEAGAVFGFDLIYGLPKDNLEGFRRSVDFALNLYPNNLETFCLAVLPGTALAEKAAELGLVWQQEPPYLVQSSDTFSASDLDKARKISDNLNLFYNQGRAVPWFKSVCDALHVRPVVLIEEFGAWRARQKIFAAQSPSHETVEQMQLDFLQQLFDSRGKKALWPAANSIIRFNGALSRVESDGRAQTVKLLFHPDDLATPYASDIQFFAKNCRQYPCSVQCFSGKNGPDWKIVPAHKSR